MSFRCVFGLAMTTFLAVSASSASADVFHMTGAKKSLEFVAVGDSGNLADTTTGLGSVAYAYQMGKYDVTAGQYVEFLNAVARTDTYGLYYASMSAAADCNIQRTSSSGDYHYSVAAASANRPVNFVSFGRAARFCNWLANGQPSGAQGLTTTEDGSYYLDGVTDNALLLNVVRKATATYVLPAMDEWYKAAYYDPNKPGGPGYWLYPTCSDSAPTAEVPPGKGSGSANYQSVLGTVHLSDVGAYVDSAGPYGTFDQGGLLYQWTDTKWAPAFAGYTGFAMMNSSFMSSDGLQLRSDNAIWPWSPTNQYSFFGFRVAEVPEPSAICLLAAGGIVAIGVVGWRKHVR